VAEAFVTTGSTTPQWPDPHEGSEGPLDEEYSRCLDPEKYRILSARAEAWVLSLTRLGLACAEEIEAPSGVWRDEPASMEPDRRSGFDQAEVAQRHSSWDFVQCRGSRTRSLPSESAIQRYSRWQHPTVVATPVTTDLLAS